MKGCYFHFNQALWRAIQRYALVNPYRNSRRLKKCPKKVMALGFLLLALVRSHFNRLRQSHATRRLIRRFPTLHDLFTYFENNYVNRNFPPRMSNVFNRLWRYTQTIMSGRTIEDGIRPWVCAILQFGRSLEC